MALNGIDISHWDPGIEVANVPSDFVIVKATGGTRYENPEFERMCDETLAAGKLLGIYHFAGDGFDGSPEEEAAHFLTVTEKYKGKFIPVLDWEADAVNWPVYWAKRWLEIVAEHTGSTPWFYSYASYVGIHDCDQIAQYPLWIAAYYAGYRPMGYQDDPHLYGDQGDFDKLVAYQYTSSGDLPGWDGALDLSIFYGDRADWMSYVNNSDPGDYEPDKEEKRKREEALREISTPNKGGEVFRLYNPNSGEHLFTTNENEKFELTNIGWNDEGAAWKFPPTPSIVYRMYNPNNGGHMYTTNFNEADGLFNDGWSYEGANFSSSSEGGIPVYRLYNPNDGRHHFTTSATEKSSLISIGWNDEGIGFYAVE